jgi:hypothetical protein
VILKLSSREVGVKKTLAVLIKKKKLNKN